MPRDRSKRAVSSLIAAHPSNCRPSSARAAYRAEIRRFGLLGRFVDCDGKSTPVGNSQDSSPDNENLMLRERL